MNTVFKVLSIVSVSLSVSAAVAFADYYDYNNYNDCGVCSPGYVVYTSSRPGERYNSYATNSTSHSREYYDPTDGLIIDEEEYYNSNKSLYSEVDYNTIDTISYTNAVTTSSFNRAGGITGVYGSPENYQYVSSGYYRGNGGDLRVYDQPYDLVSFSQSIRGGVARAYDTTYINGSAWNWNLIIAVLIIAAIGYALGRGSTKL